MNQNKTVRQTYYSTETTTYGNGITPPLTLANEHFIAYSSFRVGQSVPNYRDKIRNCVSATSPFQGKLSLVESNSEGFMKLTRYLASGQLKEETIGFGTFNTPQVLSGGFGNFNSVNNTALKGILKRVKNERTSFQGGIFLGELGETLRMLTSPAKALRQGISDYMGAAKSGARKRRGNKARGKFLSETWLEYSYGWAPLLHDIEDAVKAYKKHVESERRNRVTYRASETDVEVEVYQNTYGHFYLIENRSTSTVKSVQWRIGLRTTTVGASPDVSVFERAGFVFSEFLPTVWELVPYSFLVDYFTNIGDIIDAGATNTSDVAWGSKTERTDTRRVWYGVPDVARAQAPPEYCTFTGSGGNWTTSTRNINRYNSSLSTPSFEVSLPSKPLQWLNMVALGHVKV